jgi:hypothetical protein
LRVARNMSNRGLLAGGLKSRLQKTGRLLPTKQ